MPKTTLQRPRPRTAPAPRARAKASLATRAAERSARSAANALLVATVCLGAGALLQISQLAGGSLAAAGRAAVLGQLTIHLGLVVLFGVLWRVAQGDPARAFLPAVVGGAIYVPLLGYSLASNPAAALSPSLIVPVCVLVGLEEGIRASLRYRQLVAKQAG